MSKELELEEYIELDEDESRELFNKFDRENLDVLEFMFYFAKSHNLNEIRPILDEVEKTKSYSNPYTDITDKNKLLSFKELNFLYNIADDGWMCTVNTRDLIDYSSEGEELKRIKNSIYKEMEKRVKTKVNEKKLIIKQTM